MPTYVVGDIQITDPSAYQAHIPRALATIARFGGRVIAGGGSRVDMLEGNSAPEWLFIIEFPTADAARGRGGTDVRIRLPPALSHRRTGPAACGAEVGAKPAQRAGGQLDEHQRADDHDRRERRGHDQDQRAGEAGGLTLARRSRRRRSLAQPGVQG